MLPPRRKASSGFTLLEMMIVLVVMGTMLAIVSLSFGSIESDPVEKDLKRLRFDVEVIANEAIIRAEPLGMGFTEQGYAFFKQDEAGSWEIIKDDRLLEPRKLGEQVHSGLFIEQVQVNLTGSLDLAEPQVFIYPTGEMTAFEYELQSGVLPVQRVEFNALGQPVLPAEENPSEEQPS